MLLHSFSTTGSEKILEKKINTLSSEILFTVFAVDVNWSTYLGLFRSRQHYTDVHQDEIIIGQVNDMPSKQNCHYLVTVLNPCTL
jgi:hypothetical protein